MKIDRKRIASHTVPVTLDAWARIFSAKHAGTPIGAGFGSSRFSSPTGAFRVLYAAKDFSTAFAEAVVRDRFEQKERRYLYRDSLEVLVVAELGTRAPLNMVDLTLGGAYELGVDTDAKAARAHVTGQSFAESVHRETPADGILFSSRLTGELCAAVFDRALHKLTATQSVELIRVGALVDEIQRLGIILRRRRSVP